MASGYSGTLATKLSLKPGLRAWFEDMPESVEPEIAGSGVERLPKPEAGIDAAMIFVTSRADLEARIDGLLPLLAPTGFLWVSWPKKTSSVPTDITEDIIRDVVLPGGMLVDVKVCAVDGTWSGLKLVIRKENRAITIARQSQ